jgi:hypothetical protein
MTAPQTLAAERRGPRERWLADAVIAGFVATGVSTGVLVIGYVLANGLGSTTGNVLQRWMWELTHNDVVSFSRGTPAIAIALHVVVGLVWALIYAGLVEYRLPLGWSGAQRGLVWGVIVWVLSWLVFLPGVGAGIAGVALGAGPLPILGNLVLHLVYGYTLGQLYDPTATRPATAEDVGYDEPLEGAAVAHSETSSAAGIVVGAVVGAAVGIGLAVVLPPSLPAIDFGGWEIALAVGGLLAGGAVGGVVGSFAGLPSGVEPTPEPDTTDPFQQVVLPFLIPPFLVLVIAAIIVSMGTILLRVSGSMLSLPFGIELATPVIAALIGIFAIAAVALWLASRPGQSPPSRRETVPDGDH